MGAQPTETRVAPASGGPASAHREVEGDVAEAVDATCAGDCVGAATASRSGFAASDSGSTGTPRRRARRRREVGGDGGEQIAAVEGRGGGLSRKREEPTSTASAAPPKRSIAGRSRPLSGPTRRWLLAAERTATARRGPDAGVDDREVDAGRREGDAAASTVAPLRTSWRLIPWVMSMTWAPGAILAITARQTPAKSSPYAVVGEERDGLQRSTMAGA